MSKRKWVLFATTAGLVVTITLCIFGMDQSSNQKVVLSDLVPGSCTIFAASFGNTVLFGNNEDYSNPKNVEGARGNTLYSNVYLISRMD
jgi:hypothetical protein